MAIAATLGEPGLSGDLVERVIQATMDHLTDELARTGRLEYRDLGVFTVESYKARKLHNPRTGALVDLPARKGVSFKPGRRLMKQVSPDEPVVVEEAPAPPTPAPRPAEAGQEGPWVTLLPSPFHAAGREALRPVSHGMASGRILTINRREGGWEGLIEIDGHAYEYKDMRYKEARAKFPLTQFLTKAMTFLFFPTVGAQGFAERAPDAGPNLRLFKMLPRLDDPGLVEVIGTVMAIEKQHVTFAVPSLRGEVFFTTMQGSCSAKAGDLVQAFGHLLDGTIRLESCHPLTVEN